MGIRIATAEAFNKQVHEHCVNVLGGRAAEYAGEPVVLMDTPAGVLRVWPATHGWRGRKTTGVFTVFCRFQDADKARELFADKLGNGLNPYSGKYNFHDEGNDADVDTVLGNFKCHIMRVL